MKTYKAFIKPWALGWEIDIPDVGVTQAESRDEIEEAARDFIALDLGVDRDSFDVDVRPEDEEPRVVVGPIEEIPGAAPQRVEIPADLELGELEAWERHVWLTPGLSIQERRIMVNALQRERMQPLLRDVS